MLPRLATSLMIACAAGCGGPLDVGGAKPAEADGSGISGSKDAGTDAAIADEEATTRLAQAIEGDWYLLLPTLFGPPLIVKLTLTWQSGNQGHCEVTCTGCKEFSAFGDDAGMSGQPPELSALQAFATEVLNIDEYWILASDSGVQGDGLFLTPSFGYRFHADLTRNRAVLTTALGPEFTRKAPSGAFDAGAP